MRDNYPSLQDGFTLTKLSNQTQEIYLAGSNNTATEVGLWSVARSPLEQGQDFSTRNAAGNTSVWMLYTNLDVAVAYTFNCADQNNALLSPYIGGETVKNLFWPYEEFTLTDSSVEFYANGSQPFFGCLEQVEMRAYEFKAFVPKDKWIEMYPAITSFSPGHDTRILSNGSSNTVQIEFTFSQNMSCDSVTNSLSINSTTATGVTAQIQQGSVSCSAINPALAPTYVGALGSVWSWSATLENIDDGVHQLTLSNISNSAGTDSTRVK